MKITNPGYEWQDNIYLSFKENGYNGFIDAKTGAGKTIASCKIIVEYRKEFPDSKIWVVAPSVVLLDQWKEELEAYGIEDVDLYTYIKGVNNLTAYRLGRIEDNTPDFMICDEAHSISSKSGTVWKRIINFGIPHVLGLSATPRGADKLLGGSIKEVGYDECNLAPSVHNCVMFNPTDREMEAYNKVTSEMREYHDGTQSNFYNDPIYRNIILKRKRVLHNMNSRFKVALKYVKLNLGKRMIIFFTSRAQVNKFSKMLDKEGIDYAVHMTGRKELPLFESKEKNILLCINMLEQGYNDPSLEVGIMVAYQNSLTKNIQKVGRLLRPYKGMTKTTYYLIARGTTDEEIYYERNKIFPPNTVQIINENN